MVNIKKIDRWYDDLEDPSKIMSVLEEDAILAILIGQRPSEFAAENNITTQKAKEIYNTALQKLADAKGKPLSEIKR